MNIIFKLRRATLLLALALPGFCWGYGPSANVLIVTETGSPNQADINAVVTFLSSRLSAASFTVGTNVGVPVSSLAGYLQIWDVRVDLPLTGPDMTAYVAYMAGGGSLFVMGENGGCCALRDTSVAALILAAGGGAVALESNSAATQTVRSPFTGPVSLSSITYAAVGGFTSIGSGSFITTDTSTSGGAVIFGPGTMSNAVSGVLAIVLDINFMDPNYPPGVNQSLTDNLIAYLAAPSIITPSVTFTLAGPTGGAIGSASGNFTITPSAAYTGTITITLAGGGLSGTIVKTFNSSSAAQTFTITPTSVGPVVLTPSNNSSLSNPPALTYATQPPPPTIGTATGGNGFVSVAFTAPGTGGSPITGYTARCGSGTGTGTSSPITVSGLSPLGTVTCTVTATNAFGTSTASAVSNSVQPALPSTPAPSTFVLVSIAGVLMWWNRRRWVSV